MTKFTLNINYDPNLTGSNFFSQTVYFTSKGTKLNNFFILKSNAKVKKQELIDQVKNTSITNRISSNQKSSFSNFNTLRTNTLGIRCSTTLLFSLNKNHYKLLIQPNASNRRNFHTSLPYFSSQENDNKNATQMDLDNKENSVSSNNDDIRLTEKKAAEMINSLKNFKHEILENKELDKTWERMKERALNINIENKKELLEDTKKFLLNENNKNLDFSNLFFKYYEKVVSNKEDTKLEQNMPLLENAVEIFIAALKKCEAEGVTKECLNQISTSKLLKKIILSLNDSKELGSEGEIGLDKGAQLEIIDEVVTQITENYLPKDIGEITLNQIYDNIKNNPFSMHLHDWNKPVNPNLIGMLFSYGLTARVFNKLTRTRPIEPGLDPMERAAAAEMIKTTKFYRLYFLTIVSPIMIITLNKFKPDYFNINLFFNKAENQNLDIQATSSKSAEEAAADAAAQIKTPGKNLIFGIIISKFNSLNHWVKKGIKLTIILLLYKCGILTEVSHWLTNDYFYNLKIILIIGTFLPIVFNIIVLYFLMDVKIRKGIKLDSINKYPDFIVSLFNKLNAYSQNENLFRYYKKFLLNWLLVYIVLFITVLFLTFG